MLHLYGTKDGVNVVRRQRPAALPSKSPKLVSLFCQTCSKILCNVFPLQWGISSDNEV